MAAVGTDEWNGRTGQSWADQWRRTDRAFGPLTEQLLQIARGRDMAQILDVGCGAGELSLALARGHPRARVVGVDVSAALIAAARTRGEHLANVRFDCADAAQWQPNGESAPDAMVSRHGVMFFEAPEVALTHLAALAAPGTHFMASCFRDRVDNPVFGEPARLLPNGAPPADPDAPGPFAWSDPAKVERWMTAAGWREVDFAPIDFAMVIGGGADPVADAVDYLLHIGPVARTAAEMSELERRRLSERIGQLAERHLHEGFVALRAAAWIVTARKP